MPTCIHYFIHLYQAQTYCLRLDWANANTIVVDSPPPPPARRDPTVYTWLVHVLHRGVPVDANYIHTCEHHLCTHLQRATVYWHHTPTSYTVHDDNCVHSCNEQLCICITLTMWGLQWTCTHLLHEVRREGEHGTPPLYTLARSNCVSETHTQPSSTIISTSELFE